MNRRDALKRLSAAEALFAHSPPVAAADDPPNIVLLLADDLGFGDLSSLGHPAIRTPNLDRAAREGLQLTSLCTPDPHSTPGRAALLTGCYPKRVGLTENIAPDAETGLPASEVTLAELLQGENYRTHAIGTWHLGEGEHLPTNQGFDHFLGLPYPHYFQPPLLRDDGKVVEDEADVSTLTERYTQAAVSTIEEEAASPFFVHLAYAMPHVPLPSGEANPSRRGRYGSAVERIDRSVGRILDALRETGQAQNTLVVFLSDSGPRRTPPDQFADRAKPWATGSTGLVRGDKESDGEGGFRVPAFARWPARIPAGRRSAEIATTMDLYATLASAAGAQVPQDRTLDGNNLLPLFTGETSTSPTDQFFYFQGEEAVGVRENEWKLQSQAGSNRLFNLNLDPAERIPMGSENRVVMFRLIRALNDFQVDAEDAPAQGPDDAELRPAHPNPFRKRATIPYVVAENGTVTLAVYDVTGRRVRTLVQGSRTPGRHTATWDGIGMSGKPVAGGVYVCRLTTPGGRQLSRTLVRAR
jgi:uncharacterized sulfatase